MEEKIKELKEKFEGSNKYMLTLSYEDIKELFAIIEVLKNKESINKIEKLKSIKDYEMISFIDIIKTLCENREKINEIIERVVNK